MGEMHGRGAWERDRFRFVRLRLNIVHTFSLWFPAVTCVNVEVLCKIRLAYLLHCGDLCGGSCKAARYCVSLACYLASFAPYLGPEPVPSDRLKPPRER